MPTKLSADTIFRNAETKHGLTLFDPNDVAWIEKQLYEKVGMKVLEGK